MKVNVSQTRSIVFICVIAFGMLQHAAWTADERQALQALSKSCTVLAQEVGEVDVGIETERSDEDKSFRFERRGGSAAAKAGLRKGDLLLEFENQPIRSVAEFTSAVEKTEDEAKVLLLVKHEGQARYVTVKQKQIKAVQNLNTPVK